MLLFRRILKFRDGSDTQQELRSVPRYTVGPAFPARCKLGAVGRDEHGQEVAGGRMRDWGCRLIDVSTTGCRIAMNSGLIVKRGDAVRLDVALGGRQLVFPCQVAHYRWGSEHSVCGLSLDLKGAAAPRAYLQMIESIAIGATLRPDLKTKQLPEAPGLKAERFVAHPIGSLLVWHKQDDFVPVYFDLELREHFLRGARTGAIEILPKSAGATGNVTPAQRAEILEHFGWVLPHLGNEVPPDVRELLAIVAKAQGV